MFSSLDKKTKIGIAIAVLLIVGVYIYFSYIAKDKFIFDANGNFSTSSTMDGLKSAYNYIINLLRSQTNWDKFSGSMCSSPGVCSHSLYGSACNCRGEGLTSRPSKLTDLALSDVMHGYTGVF